jgi:Na+-translocating ferredoxin:NAD+ oxidoreductase RnfG subunit
MPGWLRFPLTLLVIGAVAGGGLALVEAQTKAEIEKNKQRKLEGAFKEVPGFKAFKPLGGEPGSRVFELQDEGGKPVAYAGEATCPKSYNGRDPVVVVVVTDPAVTKVLLVRTTNNKETPGLGTRVSDKAPPASLASRIGLGSAAGGEGAGGYPFLDRFKDRPVDRLAYEKGTDLDAISGVTVSSTAVLNGVKLAVENVRKAVGKK